MISKYGLQHGLLASLATWSFFVLCTPVADAGFLIDFPVRLLTGLKMFYSEIMVWLVAIIITLFTFFFQPQVFATHFLLQVFHKIISQLFPYGIIIVLSCFGSFLSIYFGDEIFDQFNHHKHHRINLFIFLFLAILTIVFYYFLIKKLGIEIPFA